MQRKALIVAGAAGPQDIANGVLLRFGFAPATSALSVSEAANLVRHEKFDLVVIPLQGLEHAELAAFEREARRHASTFVVGTAAQTDSDLILRAMRSGVHEFLVYPPEPTELAAAVDRLLRRTHSEGKAGTTVAVFSAKGGLGTTSVAVNLAFGLAKGRPNGRVALLDLVASGGDVRVMLNLRPTYDIGDLVKKMDQLDAELLHSMLTPCEGGVWVLPSAEDEEAVEGLDAPATTAVIENLRGQFAYTVVDCEHHMGERTLAALDIADRVLVVTQLSVAALRSTQRTLSLCRRLGYSDEKVVVVVNRHQSADVVSVADAAQVLKRSVFFALPNDYQTLAAALTRGVPVLTHAASSPIAASYGALATKLTGDQANGNGKKHGSSGGSRLGRIFSIGRK
jgi:pilus assembly protein CpaE